MAKVRENLSLPKASVQIIFWNYKKSGNFESLSRMGPSLKLHKRLSHKNVSEINANPKKSSAKFV